MSKKQTQITAEQLYKKNKTKAKVFNVLSPILFYMFLLLAVLFFFFMANNSIGNVTEILDMLNADKYSGEQIEENYKYLIDKWGEWEMIGADSSGLVIRYVNIGNALFSGLMMIHATFMFISFVLSIVLGKVIFPLLAKHFTNINEEMVDIATLQSASKIDKISRKEWF